MLPGNMHEPCMMLLSLASASFEFVAAISLPCAKPLFAHPCADRSMDDGNQLCHVLHSEEGWLASSESEGGAGRA